MGYLFFVCSFFKGYDEGGGESRVGWKGGVEFGRMRYSVVWLRILVLFDGIISWKSVVVVKVFGK